MSYASVKFLKAKPGDYFYETLAGFEDDTPRILKFIRLNIAGVPGFFMSVHFEVCESGEEIIVDADDRYGRLVPLTNANERKIEERANQLQAELEKYSHLLGQIARYRK